MATVSAFLMLAAAAHALVLVRPAAGIRITSPHMSAALPKEETGVAALLNDTPEADGRGTLVAVLDTGCDLAAAGLLKTSDGKPKFVDVLDCTGGGDVDTSAKAKRHDDGTITGLSGRKLRLGSWADGVDEIRIGAVRLFALLPRSVLARVKRERKAAFARLQHEAISVAQEDLDRNGSPAGSPAKKEAEARLKELKDLMDGYEDSGPVLDVLAYEASDGWRVVVSGGQTEPSADAADTAVEDDLSAAVPMAPYRIAQQVSELGFGTALTYAVQVYESGSLVSVVVDSGSHGTHVAGIVAAHFEEDSQLDGVAPGAQVLACKIGDGRLGSAETGTGLVRALIAAKAAGCDLINLSFGEPFYQPDVGRVSETFTDAVRKWQMGVFTSAGNDGPALTSLGAPGHLSAPITIGAYVSTAMMAEQYSMLGPDAADGDVLPTSYSFSSRGPTPDGWLPTLCAPGGAIAPVPRHTLQGKAQYHGTSMSSPNACGVAACVLSALRQSEVGRIGPIELRRALENSAKPVETPDPWAQGFGLINAPAAIRYATEHHGKPGQDVEFKVSVPSRAGARGIYLRDPTELAGPHAFGVLVKPHFEHASPRTDAEVEELLNLEIELALTSDAPWVVTPASMVLTSGAERGGQSFTIRLDLNSLPSGAHHARVLALDANDRDRGPLFTLPVSVIVPHAVAPLQPTNFFSHVARAPLLYDDDQSTHLELPLSLPAGAPVRRFLVAPESAEWASVRLVTGAMPRGPHNVILHAVPSARGDVPNAEVQFKKMIALREHSEEVVHVTVRSGSTWELCMQLSWLSNPSPVNMTAHVEYHSHSVRGAALWTGSSRALRIGAAENFARLEVGAPLRTEALRPKAELTEVHRAIKPSKATVSTASAELDVLPPSDAQLAYDASAVGTQLHQMVLTYSFDVAPADKEETVSITPRVASLHEQLYDSPLDSMLWRLESAGTGAIHAYGGLIHDAAPIKLRKGSYVVSMLLRHPDPAMLKALEELPLLLVMKLSKPIDMKLYNHRGAASTGGADPDVKPIANGWLRRGGHRSLYVCRPGGDKLPSYVSPGDALAGRVVLDKEAESVTRVPIVCEAPPKSDKKKGGDEASGGAAASDAQDKDTEEVDEGEEDKKALDDALLDAKLARLTALRTSGASSARYAALSDALFEESRSHLPLLLERLAWARAAPLPESAAEGEAAASWRASQVGAAADEMLSPDGPIDTAALAQYWGVAHDEDETAGESKAAKAAKKLKKEMEDQRKALRLALFAKAAALAPSGASTDGVMPLEAVTATLASAADPPEPVPFTEAVSAMKQWVTKPEDVEEEERDGLALTLAQCDLMLNRPSSALAQMRKRMKAQPASSAARAKDVALQCVIVYRALGWEHWASNAEEVLADRYPVTKVPL